MGCFLARVAHHKDFSLQWTNLEDIGQNKGFPMVSYMELEKKNKSPTLTRTCLEVFDLLYFGKYKKEINSHC